MLRSLILIFGIYFILFTPAEGNASPDNYLLTKDECINAANFTVVKGSCCFEMDLVDEAANACQLATRNDPLTEDANLNYIRLSIIIECIYEKRNFIESSDQLNMTAVAVHAKRYYQSNQQDFIINKYTACERIAFDSLHGFQSNPDAKAVLEGTHKPYFIFVFLCMMGSVHTDCPYFVWKGYGPNGKLCNDYARQCRERFFEERFN